MKIRIVVEPESAIRWETDGEGKGVEVAFFTGQGFVLMLRIEW